ncbi:hypothetical protein Tco_0827759 [Tanacetum coccineum]
MFVSTSMTFSSANSTGYLASTVDGTMSLKGQILAEVRRLSTRFYVLAIIVSITLTSGPLKVLSVRESHNLRDSNSQKAYTDSDYARASLDRKSTTGGCQFLGCRLISWQCMKQTVVANSTTEAEYVAASSCCRQVLWIQNQLLDYGYNFMHTKIFIDNNRKAKKSVRLMMEKLFRMELELILVTQS